MTILTTPGTNNAFAPDVQGLAPEQLIPESLLMLATTRVGVVEGDDVFVRVPLIDLTDEPEFVAEGAPIPESEPDVDEAVIANGKIGVLVKISKEQLAQPNVTEIVSGEIDRALSVKVNAALLNQPAPVSPAVLPPAGILAQGTTVVDPMTGNLDKFVDAVSLIESLPGGAATNVVAAPDAWAKICKMKTATGSNQSLVGAGVDPAQRTLLGIPVKVDSSMASNKLAVLDKRRVLSVYGNIQVSKSDHAYFSSDVIGIKATIRLGAKVNGVLAVQVLTVS